MKFDLPGTPVKLGPDVERGLSELFREISGRKTGTVTYGKPKGSPYASTNMQTYACTMNLDALIRNPYRNLRKINPYYLRLEAVMTGALLHEAAHALYSDDLIKIRQMDGVREDVKGLLTMLEEPRIERMLGESKRAAGLDWTMNVTAAVLIPPYTTSDASAEQELINLISAWILRAGRYMYARSVHGDWVYRFTVLLESAFARRLEEIQAQRGESPDPSKISPTDYAPQLRVRLAQLITEPSLRTEGRVAMATGFMEVLFPEDTGASFPSPCGESMDVGEKDEPSEGSGEAKSGVDSSDAQALADAISEMTEEMQEGARKAEDKEMTGVPSMGSGDAAKLGHNRRQPTPEERDIARSAGTMLRSLLDPSETSHVNLSSAPAATVDPAEMALWKAGGQRTEPRFFRRTSRASRPTPPVRVGIAVDVSSSMKILQTPSAQMAWALASAAHDLRNFAGRGSQVDSAMVHWNTQSEVIQPSGSQPRGLYEQRCSGGTSAMASALRDLDAELPGFLMGGEERENRLLVQFTDWGLNAGRDAARSLLTPAIRSGLKMLIVAPPKFSYHLLKGTLPDLHFGVDYAMITYGGNPAAIWAEATALLNH